MSLLKFSSHGRKNDSPVSLTAPKSLIESYAPVTGSDGRLPAGNHAQISVERTCLVWSMAKIVYSSSGSLRFF